jgi:hypothetical protein
MKLDPNKDEKTRKAMAEKLPIGSVVTVDGKPGTVVAYALHSKQYIIAVGGENQKFPIKAIKPA